MSRTWLLALVGISLAACTCPPDRREMKAFAPAKIFQDDIKQCEAYGNCDALCISLFSLDASVDTIDRCRITRVQDAGVAVVGVVELGNVCAPDGDLVIGDDGSYVDDGGDDGTVDDGSSDDGSDDGTVDDGSGSDDGTVDDGGGDDGSTGDDGGDDGGGDDGGDDGLAPHHHVAKHKPTA